MATVTIKKNKDQTITIRVGNYREYVSIESKTPMQILDAVRYAAITAGVTVSEEIIWEQLQSQLYE
jgi:hypothetical protein